MLDSNIVVLNTPHSPQSKLCLRKRKWPMVILNPKTGRRPVRRSCVIKKIHSTEHKTVGVISGANRPKCTAAYVILANLVRIVPGPECQVRPECNDARWYPTDSSVSSKSPNFDVSLLFPFKEFKNSYTPARTHTSAPSPLTPWNNQSTQHLLTPVYIAKKKKCNFHKTSIMWDVGFCDLDHVFFHLSMYKLCKMRKVCLDWIFSLWIAS